MAQSIVLKGSEIKIFISGKLYNEVQSITWTIDYGEKEIYGIDSQFAQEIAPTKIAVQGKITGVRVKNSAGLQGKAARTRISEILHAPYTSLRVSDRHSNVDILWLPQMKVVSESLSVQAKGIASLSFTFKGIIPYQPIDLSSTKPPPQKKKI